MCLDGIEPTDCEDGDIRLTGGSQSNIGRVEICRGNVWGTVCYSLSTYDANVICRTLGYLNEGIIVLIFTLILSVFESVM